LAHFAHSTLSFARNVESHIGAFWYLVRLDYQAAYRATT
jgi:hypothetical protein